MSAVLSRIEHGIGLRVAVLDAGSIRLEAVRAGPGVRIPPHLHSRPHFSLVLDGAMTERDGRGARRLLPGDGRSSPAGDAHEIRLGDRGLHCVILHIGGATLADAELGEADGRTYARGGRIPALGARLGAEIERADDASPVAIEMLALEVAALFSRSASGRAPGVPPWLSRIHERLRDEPRSAPTLAELAADAGVSRAHVARAFRAHYGCTVGDHLRAIRVEAARMLLIETDEALASVAYRCGFADQSHMTREVRDRLGLTPQRLRGAARGGPPPRRAGPNASMR